MLVSNRVRNILTHLNPCSSVFIRGSDLLDIGLCYELGWLERALRPVLGSWVPGFPRSTNFDCQRKRVVSDRFDRSTDHTISYQLGENLVGLKGLHARELHNLLK